MVDSNHLDFKMLDSTHPAQITAIDINFQETIIIISSKSGTTIETVTLFEYFFDLYSQEITDPGQYFIAITDKDSYLEKLSQKHQFLHCFINPCDIGGRYSALSFFGLVPAAFMGIDLDRLMHPVKALISELSQVENNVVKQEVLSLAYSLGTKAKSDLVLLNLTFNDTLLPLFDWIEQLVAESTGKHGKGVLPISQHALIKANEQCVNVEMSLKDKGVSDDAIFDATFYVNG